MTTLHGVIKANAASCLLFGVLFLTLPAPVASFLAAGAPAPAIVLQVIGAVLVLNGLQLTWTALQAVPAKGWILYFSAGDFLWVLATAVLLMTGVWVTSPAGVAVSLAVALMVGAFGVMQIRLRRAMCE